MSGELRMTCKRVTIESTDGVIYEIEMHPEEQSVRLTLTSEPVEMPATGLWRRFVAGPARVQLEVEGDVKTTMRRLVQSEPASGDVELAPELRREIVKEAQRLARTWGIPAADRSDKQSYDRALVLAAYGAGYLAGEKRARKAA